MAGRDPRRGRAANRTGVELDWIRFGNVGEVSSTDRISIVFLISVFETRPTCPLHHPASNGRKRGLPPLSLQPCSAWG
ncbi:hypothetical protein RBSWK_04079 [Rhodopirellula baltica SWK14]|uniref:Uncharacterized protein n=1 Tax=Rhodopirellula baltica SWK14 TaxID=993516 RepID=L7CCJ2_RHOBT|nr:hypothetical protein RBSWK_04079 [Rhodopirellula baltica SWK14]